MLKFILFILYWLFIMALIGGALLLVQRYRPKKQDKATEKEAPSSLPCDPSNEEENNGIR